MFANHVTENLSAYCNDELGVIESRAVAEHLIACGRCREEFEEIRFGVNLAERLPKFVAPESIWLNLEKGATIERQTVGKRFRWQPVLAFAAIIIVIAGALVFAWNKSRDSRPTWQVARLDGAPRIGNSQVKQSGRLAVGQWLETDDGSRAQIDVSSIGQVEIDPNTRVRLVETNSSEHRLELARGKMSAKIWAPPRLFFVDTPSAVAADLGCAYTLEVQDDGSALLQVTAGLVSLQLQDRESTVPAGAACETRPGVGPGTPYFVDAAEVFRWALSRIDFGPHNETKIPDLDTVLLTARPRDTFTLWHLLRRVNENDRGRLFDRMATLLPPAPSVTRAGVVRLDKQMLETWKAQIDATSNNSLKTSTDKPTKSWASVLGSADGLQGKQ